MGSAADAGGPRLLVGLMSGTSMDGVDAALVWTDGEDVVEQRGFVTLPYDESMRERLRDCMALALVAGRPGPEPRIDETARHLTLAHAAAVRALLEATGVEAGDLQAIGFHGQTIAHRPDGGWTWQIGDGALLAQLTGVTVVDDFRSADVAAGGEGAPLVPVYHRALVGRLRAAEPALADALLAVLNLGGVGNITWFSPDGRWGAFDTGPGNALIDDWVSAGAGLSHDAGGRIAAGGRVREDVLAAMLDLPWFDQQPPKSLDRHDFTLQPARGLSLADGAATLTAFTAATVALAFRHLPERPARLLVTGGGRRNPVLMRIIAERTGVPTAPVESVGWNGDALEAEAFAYLARRVLDGRPTSFPETTGAAHPVCGGAVHRPQLGGARHAVR